MAFLTRRTMLSSTAVALVMSGLPARAQTSSKGVGPDTEWRNYAGDLANTRYAPLDQINAGNFDKLEVAWRFPSSILGSRPEYCRGALRARAPSSFRNIQSSSPLAASMQTTSRRAPPVV